LAHHFLEGHPGTGYDVFMPECRRAFEPGGMFFFTLVTHQRKGLLCEPLGRGCLRRAFKTVQAKYPFDVVGIVLLPDHLHCLWKLPDNDSDFSIRWQYIKGEFTRNWRAGGGGDERVSPSRRRRREREVWQRRFWEHAIREERDMIRHLDYIHYNPVKHGLARCPHQWESSTFDQWVRKRVYDPDWQCQCTGQHRQPPDFDLIECLCGE